MGALVAAGRFDEALARYREALQLQPAYAEAHYNLALTLRQMGRLDETADQYKQALELGWKN